MTAGATRPSIRRDSVSSSPRSAVRSRYTWKPPITRPVARNSSASATLACPGTISSTPAISGVANRIRVCAARLGRLFTSRICRRLMDTAMNSRPASAGCGRDHGRAEVRPGIGRVRDGHVRSPGAVSPAALSPEARASEARASVARLRHPRARSPRRRTPAARATPQHRPLGARGIRRNGHHGIGMPEPQHDVAVSGRQPHR